MVDRKEILIFLFFILFFIAYGIGVNYPHIVEYNYHFGGEYGNIAASVVKGDGYANVFETNSGPTSWMPPFYTYLLAFIFLLFGVKTTLSVYVLLGLKFTSLSIIPVLLFRICKDICHGYRKFFIFLIYLFFILYSRYTIFYMIHDIWIVMLLITLLFYKYISCVVNQKEIGKGWGVLSGVAFLTNPILGMISIVLTFLPYTKICLKKKLIILAVTLIVCSPWFIRNYLVFNQVILVKSNLFFDMYQSNYLDDDGVLSVETFEKFHPYKNWRMRKEYTLLGEKKYMDLYHDKFFSELRSRPMTFIGKSVYRFLRIHFIYPHFNPQPQSDTSSMGTEPLNFKKVISNKKAIFYPIPFLLSVFFLLHKKFRNNKVIHIAICIYILYLLPYTFVGFYNRYRIPLIPIFSILCFYFIVYLSAYFSSFSRMLNPIKQYTPRK